MLTHPIYLPAAHNFYTRWTPMADVVALVRRFPLIGTTASVIVFKQIEQAQLLDMKLAGTGTLQHLAQPTASFTMCSRAKTFCPSSNFTSSGKTCALHSAAMRANSSMRSAERAAESFSGMQPNGASALFPSCGTKRPRPGELQSLSGSGHFPHDSRLLGAPGGLSSGPFPPTALGGGGMLPPAAHGYGQQLGMGGHWPMPPASSSGGLFLPPAQGGYPPNLPLTGPPTAAPQLGGPQLGGPQLGGPPTAAPQLGGPQLGGPQLGGPPTAAPQLGGASLGGASLGGASLGGAPQGEPWLMAGPPLSAPPVSEPSLGAPPVGEPSLGAPSVGEPSLGAPPVGEPSLGAPSVGEPSLDAPPLGEPSLGEPSLGGPPAPPAGELSLGAPSVAGPSGGYPSASPCGCCSNPFSSAISKESDLLGCAGSNGSDRAVHAGQTCGTAWPPADAGGAQPTTTADNELKLASDLTLLTNATATPSSSDGPTPQQELDQLLVAAATRASAVASVGGGGGAPTPQQELDQLLDVLPACYLAWSSMQDRHMHLMMLRKLEHNREHNPAQLVLTAWIFPDEGSTQSALRLHLVCFDQPGVLGRVSAILYMSGITILEVGAFCTTDHRALDIFSLKTCSVETAQKADQAIKAALIDGLKPP